MKKTAAVILLLGLAVLLLGGCAVYHEDELLGKSSLEIEAMYGSFDCVGMPVDEDGLYRNTFCGYTVKEPIVGFLGTSPEELFFIHFDENGIAVGCSEGYRPGG